MISNAKEKMMVDFLDTKYHEDIGRYLEECGYGSYEDIEDCEWDEEYGEYQNPTELYDKAMSCLNDLPSELDSYNSFEREWVGFKWEQFENKFKRRE